MQIYVVGGAVRDSLLGLPVKDRDYVVVGATPDEMVALGYRPVGKDFPVFLHPKTQEEYALARTERKTAPGYKGFVFHTEPDVTLEQDLIRRDLTINAIAQGPDGTLIDPHGGQQDIGARVFRHVSDAFAEDPVRILRLARFQARFGGFTIAPETLTLMRTMVAAGEVDALVAERVWQELARGLMADHPEAMFAVLRLCGALPRLAPELIALWCGDAMPELARAPLAECVRRDASLALRYAALVFDSPAPDAPALIAALSQRWRVPKECSELALLAAREKTALRARGDAEATVSLLERCDALRKPQRFTELLGLFDAPPLATALQVVRAVDAGAIAATVAVQYPGQPQKIAEAVHAARVHALNLAMPI